MCSCTRLVNIGPDASKRIYQIELCVCVRALCICTDIPCVCVCKDCYSMYLQKLIGGHMRARVISQVALTRQNTTSQQATQAWLVGSAHCRAAALPQAEPTPLSVSFCSRRQVSKGRAPSTMSLSHRPGRFSTAYASAQIQIPTHSCKCVPVPTQEPKFTSNIRLRVW